MQKKTKESAIEKIANEVTKHSEILKNVATKRDLENFATKQDLNEVKQDINMVKIELSEFKNETITRLDKIIATQVSHEQERIFAYEQTKRHEEQIEEHTKEIKEIKEVLHIK